MLQDCTILEYWWSRTNELRFLQISCRVLIPTTVISLKFTSYNGKEMDRVTERILDNGAEVFTLNYCNYYIQPFSESFLYFPSF